MLRLCVVVNDDDLSKGTVEAASIANGHLMHSFIDDDGDTRQAYYGCTQSASLPEDLAAKIGQKRSRKEAYAL